MTAPLYKAFVETMGPIEERLVQEILSACRRAERQGDHHVVLTARQGEALTEYFRWSGWPSLDVSIATDNYLVPEDWMLPQEEEE